MSQHSRKELKKPKNIYRRQQEWRSTIDLRAPSLTIITTDVRFFEIRLIHVSDYSFRLFPLFSANLPRLHQQLIPLFKRWHGFSIGFLIDFVREELFGQNVLLQTFRIRGCVLDAISDSI